MSLVWTIFNETKEKRNAYLNVFNFISDDIVIEKLVWVIWMIDSSIKKWRQKTLPQLNWSCWNQCLTDIGWPSEKEKSSVHTLFCRAFSPIFKVIVVSVGGNSLQQANLVSIYSKIYLFDEYSILLQEWKTALLVIHFWNVSPDSLWGLRTQLVTVKLPAALFTTNNKNLQLVSSIYLKKRALMF